MGRNGHEERGVTANASAPRLRDDLLPRGELVGRLRSASVPIVAVEAGAGYGKTTLLRLWSMADARPDAWLTLDRSDDDPAALSDHVVEALTTLRPSSERIAAATEVDLTAAVPGPFLLVLDDVHEVTAPEAVAFLGRLLDQVPTGSVVALAGRSLAALHLARREVAGTVCHLGPADLAFDTAETVAALGPAAVGLDAAGLDRLVAMVEGWPAGVALASAVLGQQPDALATLTALPTSRLVRAYVDQELLAAADPASEDFVLHTAVLARLTGPLCDAVLETTGSAERLEAMAAAGDRFLSTLEGEVPWYRFHPLVGEALAAELRRRDPALEATLHRRAAEWWRAAGDPDEAIHHALAAGDHRLAAAVVAEALFDCLDTGRLATLHRWMAAFPEAERSSHPELALVAGWLALLAGRHDELAGWLDLLAAESPDLAVPRAALAMVASRDGVKQSIRDAETVLAAGRDGNPWWPTAVHLRVVGRVAAGLVEGEERVAELTTALLAVGERGLMGAVIRANLALAHFAVRRYESGHEHSRRAVAELEALGGDVDPLTAMVPAVQALSRGVQGDRSGSTDLADPVFDLALGVRAVMPRGAVQVFLVLAEAALGGSDRDRADRAIAAAVETLPDVPDAPFLEAWLARVEQRRSRLGRADRQALELTPAERRILQELPTHRSLQEIADRVYVSRNTVKTHTMAIYRKLGVSGRSAAVARAAELGLFDESPHRGEVGDRR